MWEEAPISDHVLEVATAFYNSEVERLKNELTFNNDDEKCIFEKCERIWNSRYNGKNVIFENPTSINAEQIVIDCINDEILGNAIQLKDNWQMEVSPIVQYIEENLPEDETIETIPYNTLVTLIINRLDELGLILQ